MVDIKPSCKGCPERRAGCHNVETCQKWGEYEAQAKAGKAKIQAERDKALLLSDYKLEWRKRHRKWNEDHRQC